MLKHFGKDEVAKHRAAIQAARQGVAVGDRSHWGRIRMTDGDRQTFLHNQSTNDFKILKPGEGCDTVFVTSTARTIDLATAYILEEEVILVVSPQRREHLLKWCDRYIFFGDEVQIQDITSTTALFSLIGPDSHSLLTTLGATQSLQNAPYATHQLMELAGQSVRVAVGTGLAIEGYTLMVDREKAATLWDELVQAGAVPMGDRAWEQLRIEQGRPAPDQELTEDYNALEACLWQAVSINKGCYIGQETIARLDTYKGVKQQLWGIRLSGAAAIGTPIVLAGEKVGVLTSQTETEAGVLGLGYVRTKAGGEGLQVEVGDRTGELIEVPFLMRERMS
jgi:folate-binding protein YgfZ